MDFSNGYWMAPGVFQKNSFHPSSSRVSSSFPFLFHKRRERCFLEEYGSHEELGSTNFHPFLDPQYIEPSFVAPPYQGNHPVGHPSSTSQHVSPQAVVSGVPSGAPKSILSSSFCAPHPHRPGCSPAPFSYTQASYDPRPEVPSVSPERLDMPRIGPAGLVQPSYSAPMRYRNRASASRPNAQPSSSTPFVRCPDCGAEYRRPQETKRHLLLHLPCWIACSFGGCTWRGHRLDTFRKHWYIEHQSTSQVPDEIGSKLYEPGPLVEGIVRGSVSMGDAENRAITWIKNIALVLDKQ
ncbi:hypothetical protein EDB87DRAFT_107056 [Lactarius vividus]|nr:hypothetical protein EDB87DRAFT_107056 [Lactarius vividus]